MRRGYTAGEYLEKAALLRAHVARPGPDQRRHRRLSRARTRPRSRRRWRSSTRSGSTGLFVFTYSPRPGTTAIRLADDVPEAEKLRRLQVLNDRQQRSQAGRNAQRVGGREEVLVDTVGERGRVSGRTRDFRIVHSTATRRTSAAWSTVEITAPAPTR